jgi:nitrogen fixation/metabolism regulation signal transduction histidine kinase
VAAIVISHRLAGPLYKFEKSASLVAGGDLTQRVHLRKDDHLAELQNKFNDMVSNMQKETIKDRKIALEVSRDLEKISGLAKDENLKNKLNEQARKLLDISKEFKL